MVRKTLKIILFVAATLLLIAVIFLQPVDRTSYQKSAYYEQMVEHLDSLEEALREAISLDTLQVGWSEVNITPADPHPLAGYGARDPKVHTAVHDSVFVRAVVFVKGRQKAGVITGDLLIFHPEVTLKIYERLPSGWTRDQLYLSATHTHSGPGGWAPGPLGESIAGEYDSAMVDHLAEAVVRSLLEAEETMKPGQIGYAEASLDDLVYNRLAGDRGQVDPWFKVLWLHRQEEQGIVGVFSAHATCLGHKSHDLSGDFPALFMKALASDSTYDFAAYCAGAVGSMGPEGPGKGIARAEWMAEQLADQVDLMTMIGIPTVAVGQVRSFHLPLPLGEPQVKVTGNLALRPYWFRMVAGDYPVHISVLKLGNTIFIGLPGDFSGELALPLYELARQLGVNLVVTSFNGGYIGYVVKDEWYDLNKYESRSMSWYGPENGAYLSEVIRRLLEILS